MRGNKIAGAEWDGAEPILRVVRCSPLGKAFSCYEPMRTIAVAFMVMVMGVFSMSYRETILPFP